MSSIIKLRLKQSTEMEVQSATYPQAHMPEELLSLE